MSSRVAAEEFLRIVREDMPSADGIPFELVSLEHGRALFRMTTTAKDLRPGDTVAGPVLFWLADLAMWAAVMSVAGSVPLAVTTDATVHFLRRPRAGVLLARADVIKAGKRLVVGEVRIANEREADTPVAHFVMTYSVPPDRGA